MPTSRGAFGQPQAIRALLSNLRAHLGMEVAFISEFRDGQRVFRYVDSDWPENPVIEGCGDPLEESYCQRVVDGRLPQVIQDAQELPEAAAIPATRTLPVGAHISVPIRTGDGRVYGTFCAFSRHAYVITTPQPCTSLPT
jgi:GAF domain-containing protein